MVSSRAAHPNDFATKAVREDTNRGYRTAGKCTCPLPFVKLHFLFPQKGFDHIDMNALTNVEKRIVRHPAFASVHEHLLIFNIKAQMQMARCRLHAVNQAVGVK